MSKTQQEYFWETLDRLTAVSHAQTEHFSEHKKIEGYQEYSVQENFPGKDRLWKRENLYGVLKLGYDPQKEKLFLFAHMKTSRYDTAAGRYQKEMNALGQSPVSGREGGNRAYVSSRREMAAVLIERRTNRPWTGKFIRSQRNRENMDVIRKLLPFFAREEELEGKRKLKAAKGERQKEARSLLLPLRESEERNGQELEIKQRARMQRLTELRKEDVRDLAAEQLIQTVLLTKDAEARRFLTGINYAYRYQKTEIEAYYRERRRAAGQAAERAEPGEDTSEEE